MLKSFPFSWGVGGWLENAEVHLLKSFPFSSRYHDSRWRQLHLEFFMQGPAFLKMNFGH